jgi:crotonobetainyl-CoA:carnitine CoA-transferase CaiB-like acyl-CoA transferase
MTLPLSGVRVLDLTNIIAGPLCSHQLAMLGAEVIKIEVPRTGDLSRKMGADPALGEKNMGASFLALNAGKRSLTLDLKKPRGKDVFLRLVRDADVVLENFRPGTMKRLGLDYPALKAVNPGVVYCAVSGFGQEGPLAQRPSYDQIIQGFCGLMSLTGDEKTAPTRAGYVACDAMAAILAAFAVAAALYRRQKTGEGEMIDVSMLDASLTTMAAWPASNFLNGGKAPVPMGNESHSASPSGTYRARDGLMNIVNNEQKQYESLCDVIGRPQLKTDPRFADRYARLRHRAEMRVALEEALQEKNVAEWERLFNEAGVPAGPILSVPQILAHPQVESRGILKRFSGVAGVGRDVTVPRVGFRLASGQPDVESPPPQLGQHTDAVLEAAGYAKDEVAALRRDGVI